MFTELLAASREGLEPWEATPRRRLVRLGRSLDAGEVRQAVDLLAELSVAREQVELDPDATDDAALRTQAAQDELAVVLGHVRGEHLPAVAEGLTSPSRHVRFFSAGALLLAGDPRSLPALQGALVSETDPLTRRALDVAVGTSRRRARRRWWTRSN